MGGAEWRTPCLSTPTTAKSKTVLWVDIKVAANAEVVAVVEDADIISSFIKVMDISPSITILLAMLAV